MSISDQFSDTLGSSPLSVAIVSPSEHHRNAAINGLDRYPDVRIREYITYPPGTEAVASLLKQQFSVVIIDLDSDPEYALELVHNICIDGSTNVIVISEKPRPELLLRCMRSGAREFLPIPISSSAMAEALARVSSRKLEMPVAPVAVAKHTAPVAIQQGKMLVFMSAKGGAGVTTLACSLGVSLAQEFGQNTLLIDLNFPLGDAALNLGLKCQYSTVSALQSYHRLDGSFLRTLLVRHESGLHVLAAPSELSSNRYSSDAIFKLLRVARKEFDYVIVDLGSRPDVQDTFTFDPSVTVYLVTQIGIPELRNSNRLIKQLQVDNGPKLEIVVNRFDTESEGIEEEQISKALTQPVQWRIPNDYASVRRMQNLATQLIAEDSEIARAILKMGESISGQAALPKKKKSLRFF
jgi:pilus assembly protein CpaE